MSAGDDFEDFDEFFGEIPVEDVDDFDECSSSDSTNRELDIGAPL